MIRKLAYFLFILFCLFYGFRLLVTRNAASDMTDFAAYIEASHRLHVGEDIYNHRYDHEIYERIRGEKAPDRWLYTMWYFYPPVLAAALIPLESLDYGSARFIWLCLSYGALLLSAYYLTRLGIKTLRSRLSEELIFCVTFLTMIHFQPIMQSFWEGQVNIFVLCALSSFLVYQCEGKLFSGGAALAVASILKVTPGLLFLVPLFQKKWRTLYGAIAVCAALSLFMFSMPFSFESYSSFLSAVQASGKGELFERLLMNVTPYKFVLTLVPASIHPLIRTLFEAGFLVLAALTATLGRKEDKDHRVLYPYALLSIIMIAISPSLLHHHLTWCFPALLIAALSEQKNEKDRIINWTFCLAVYLFLSNAYSLHAISFLQERSNLVLSATVPSICLLLLALRIINIWQLDRSQKA